MRGQGTLQAAGPEQKYMGKAGGVIRNLALGEGWPEPFLGTLSVHIPSEDSRAGPPRNETSTNPRTALGPQPDSTVLKDVHVTI